MEIFKSRTVWTVVAIMVLNNFQIVQPFMPDELYVLINGILSALAVYFRVFPKQQY
jgi:membrane protein DedA with SNARE-associated domain